MASASSSSSPSSSATVDGFKYDVFLSFRGEDTRYDFTGSLWKALDDKGIRTFFDEEDIDKGDDITPSLLESIKQSKMALVVLSKNYASSTFCLNELSHIIDCMKGNDRLIWPIFYDVEPSDVRKLKRTYEEAMTIHEANSKYSTNRVEKWKKALNQVANLSGTHFKKGEEYQYKFIEEIVEKISTKIKPLTLHNSDNQVGLEDPIKDVISLLNLGSDDEIRMVGIHGIGGVGKTTLAVAVFNSITTQFQVSCYLENVRENFEKCGLTYLQEIILSKIVGGKKIELTSIREGIEIIKQRLGQKKVLLLLDDVDKEEQLQAIAGRPDWFGRGSRVIITTRDTRLLTCHEVEHKYEVNELNKEDAFELLKQKAIRTNEVPPNYMGVLNRALRYASGLPLALEVIGSLLFKKTVEECKYVLDRYERIPNPKIQTILKVSFDALDEEEKCVFLDIACVFKWFGLKDVEKKLHAHYGDSKKYHINLLIEKSLIKIGELDTVTLHDLIADMGNEIARQESPNDPRRRSRLWLVEDIVQVLEENKKFVNLRILKISNCDSLTQIPNISCLLNLEVFGLLDCNNLIRIDGSVWLLDKLQTLIIYDCKKLKSIPPLKLSSLEVFHLCNCSDLESFPLVLDGSLGKLISLKVMYCKNLKGFPQLKLPSLEELYLLDCGNLESFLPLVDGWVAKLKFLEVKCCYNHISIPPIKAASLELLEFSCDCCYDTIPDIEEVRLHWDDTPLKELPFSFQALTCLQTLHLENCGIVQFPASSIVAMSELVELKIMVGQSIFPNQDEGEQEVILMQSSRVELLTLFNCKLSDESLAIGLKWFANVKELVLSFSEFTILPECIKNCHFLWKLVMDYCQELQEIKVVPPNLKTISAFNCSSLTSSCTSKLLNQELHKFGNTNFILPGVEIPNWFDGEFMQGLSISFWFRNKFPAIALCVVSPMAYSDDELCLKVTINGMEYFYKDGTHSYHKKPKVHHLRLFNMQNRKFHVDLDKELSENKWNHAVIDFECGILNCGIYVLKEIGNMEDIRFTNPENDISM